MGYHPTTKCREYHEGQLSRRRIYNCRVCHLAFQVDTIAPLPEIDRVCLMCKIQTHIYTFVNKRSGRDVLIRASNAELATLKAWQISPNLTFKIPQTPTAEATI